MLALLIGGMWLTRSGNNLAPRSSAHMCCCCCAEMVPQKIKIGDMREQLQQQLDEVTPKCLDDS
jgi:hypothetical protein